MPDRRNVKMPEPLHSIPADLQEGSVHREALIWFVARTPGQDLTAEDFELRSSPLPDVRSGDLAIRGRYHLISPSLRAQLTYRTYAVPLGVGDPVPGTLLGVVETSAHPQFAAGDWVMGSLGWRTHAVVPGELVTKLDPSTFHDVPPEAALGSLGVNGLAANIGLFDIGRARPGETVLISSAAGAVGSIACQLAKLAGCKVIGIAGSAAKCEGLMTRFGLEGTINYKDATDLAEAIGRACPDGVDVFFDNVGGRTLDAATQNLNDFGRAVICGRTATYAEGDTRVGGFSPSRRLRFEAFIAFDHAHRFPDIRRKMAGLVREGNLRDDYTIIDGIENSIDRFLALFSGDGATNPLIRIS